MFEFQIAVWNGRISAILENNILYFFILPLVRPLYLHKIFNFIFVLHLFYANFVLNFYYLFSIYFFFSSVRKTLPNHSARNRYNLRTSASPDKSADENADNASIGGSSTTQRISAGVRPRVPFNLRGRSRPTPAAPTSSDSESSASSSSSLPDDAHTAEAQEPKVEVEKPGHSTVAALKPSSRFNLRRPNQLLSARGRVSPLLKTSATTESTKTSDGTNSPDNEKEVTAVTVPDNNSSGNGNNNNKESSDEGDQGNAEASTQPQTGLSRLRNRPRIQIKPRTPNADAKAAPTPLSAANRKVNPLISRRKLGGSTSTTTTG